MKKWSRVFQSTKRFSQKIVSCKTSYVRFSIIKDINFLNLWRLDSQTLLGSIFVVYWKKKIIGYYYGIGVEYYLLLFIFAGLSMFVSSRLKSKFKTYSKLQLRNGMSGAENDEKMLSDHGIRDVKVVSVKGSLTDH